MIKLTLFNTLRISMFDRCILGIVFDTSRCKFSFDLKLGLFYPICKWYNSTIEFDEKHGVVNTIIDATFPVLYDLRLYIEH